MTNLGMKVSRHGPDLLERRLVKVIQVFVELGNVTLTILGLLGDSLDNLISQVALDFVHVRFELVLQVGQSSCLFPEKDAHKSKTPMP